MSLQAASAVATWLEQTYLSYLRHLSEGGEKVSYEGGLSGNWTPGDHIRVSKLAGECPLWAAAESKGIVKKELSDSALIRTADGTTIAESQVYPALAWACKNDPRCSFKAEVRTQPGQHYSNLVGTIDGVLYFGLQFAIEVKRTDADQKKYLKPVGITLSHMLQCIGEMVLLSKKEYRDSPFGFVFSRFNCDSDPVCKVWTIAWSEKEKGWRLYYKDQIQYTNTKYWPTDENGAIFVGVDDYLRRVELHRKYMEVNNPLTLEPPYAPGEDWHCGKTVRPEYYSPSGKYNGSLKPDTGYIEPKCPLFESCFGKRLKQVGYDPEQKLSRYSINTEIEFVNREEEIENAFDV